MPYNKYIPSMRRFHWISLGVFALLAVVPLGVHASTIFNPIVSGECLCPGRAPDWGCVLQTFQAAMNDFVSFAVVIITLFIAQAGFTYMTSPTNPEKRQLANKRLLNAVIGLLIVLCAWLLIDSLMKVIYNQNSGFGPWNSILVSNGNDLCIKEQQAPSAMQALQQLAAPTNGGGGGVSSYGKAGAMCSAGNSACSVQSLQASGLTSAQAQAMSCIAVTESSGNPNSPKSSSGACGTFQILSGHQTSTWNLPAYHTGSCSVNTSCNDASCNLQTAVIMFKQSGYNPWICPGCNAKAHACVAQYDPGHGE